MCNGIFWRFLFAWFLVIWLTGCDRTNSPADAAEPTAQAEEEPFEILYEDYQDPEFLKTPRLQFVWNPPGTPADRHGRGIWSMRLDGTDLRLAVPPELFTYPSPGSFDTTVPFERSPNLRYIVWAMEGECPVYCYQRRLIDLKSKKVKVLTSESGGPPRFHWTKDSRRLYFKYRGALHRYDLETEQLTNIDHSFEREFPQGFTLNHDETQLIGATTQSIDYYDLVSGKMLRSLPLGGSKRFSADSRYVMASDMGTQAHTIYETENLVAIFKMPMSTHIPAPFVLNQSLFYITHSTVRQKAIFSRHIWGSGEEVLVTELPKGGGRATNLSYIFTR